MVEQFADTFYYIALLNRADHMHSRAVEATKRHPGRMVTTTAVLTELADGIAGSRNARTSSVFFLPWKMALLDVVIVDADFELFRRGVDLYSHREDKELVANRLHLVCRHAAKGPPRGTDR